MRLVLPLIALAAVAAPAVAAPAIERTVDVPVRIAYGDLDITSAEGRAVLEARIDAELRKACSAEGNGKLAYGLSTVDPLCVAKARNVALAQVERAVAAQTRSGRAVAAN